MDLDIDNLPYGFDTASTAVAALLAGLFGPTWVAASLTGAALALAALGLDRARGVLGFSASARARLGGTLATAGAAGMLWSAWTAGAASLLAGLILGGWGLLALMSALTFLAFGEGYPPSEEERREAFEGALRSTVEGGRR